MRLTKTNRQRLLDQNEGFNRSTSYEGKNSSEYRIYEIKNGKLFIRKSGSTSWSDSHYSDEWEADDEQIHRFLYKYLDELNTDGIE